MDEVFKTLKNKKISRFAIMGGTFDPVHIGHIAAAKEVKDQYRLERIVFMPAGDPPHKNISAISSFEHRFNMVDIAISDIPYFVVSGIENSMAGKTYTVDTMRQIRAYIGNEAEIYFITGADSIIELSTWKSPGELLSYCRILSVPRPGYDKREYMKKIDELNNKYNGRVEMVEIPSVNISSTDIRKRVANGVPITHMVPEAVEKYISVNHLYLNRGDEENGLYR